MKKTNLSLTILAILFSCFLNSSYAQYNQWNFGFEGGPSSTALIGNNLVDLDTKPDFGFITGLFGQYNINQYYSIKMAANYQQKGAKTYLNQTTPTGSISLEGKTDIYYITIPVMFRANYSSFVKFFVNAGPYLGILLSNKTKIDPTANYAGRDDDNTDSTASTDFGISGGLGLSIPLSASSMISLEFRDDIGLTNVLGDYAVNNDAITDNDVSTKNNAFSIILGFTFGAGKKYSTTKK